MLIRMKAASLVYSICQATQEHSMQKRSSTSRRYISCNQAFLSPSLSTQIHNTQRTLHATFKTRNAQNTQRSKHATLKTHSHIHEEMMLRCVCCCRSASFGWHEYACNAIGGSYQRRCHDARSLLRSVCMDWLRRAAARNWVSSQTRVGLCKKESRWA